MGPKLSPFAAVSLSVSAAYLLGFAARSSCGWCRLENVAGKGNELPLKIEIPYDAINNHNLSQVHQCLAAGFHAVLKAQAS